VQQTGEGFAVQGRPWHQVKRATPRTLTAGEHTFDDCQGSAYARFRRALKTENLTVIRNAAAELPRVDLGDALAVCVLIRQAEPERFQRAALRWLARFCVERRDAIARARSATPRSSA
jgi:hypothetical protein